MLGPEPQSAATTESLQKSRAEQGLGIPGAFQSSIISAGRRGGSGPVVCCIGNALAKDTFAIVWLILLGCRCFCKGDLFNKTNPSNPINQLTVLFVSSSANYLMRLACHLIYWSPHAILSSVYCYPCRFTNQPSIFLSFFLLLSIHRCLYPVYLPSA